MIWPAFYIGSVGISLFLIIRSGLLKSWFLLKTLPGLMSARMFYAVFPMGIGFIFLSMMPLLPEYDPKHPPLLYFLSYLVWFLLGFWFMYRPPKWLKPGWLQWLEREYGYCLPILIEEGQKMNRWQWEAQVRTRSGMQAWIDNVFTRRREDVDFAWQAEKYYLVEQQAVREKTYGVKPEMVIKGDVPVHRRNDIVLTQKEIDTFFASDNHLYRPDEKYMRR